MIPKRIHYCWFGRNPKPKLAMKCIKSWKKYCPNYEIIEWNEDNFDIASAPLYVRQAYEAKKWAFVTDYVRLKVIYDNGGIYFDTDVQVINNIDRFLNFHAFFGFESNSYIATGLGFGAEKESSVLKRILEQYNDIPFILADGSIDTTPCPQRNTEIFKEIGLIQNGKTQFLDHSILILSSDYLCPLDCETRRISKTRNTVSIHWFDASWHTKKERMKYLRMAKEKKRKEHKYKMKTAPKRVLMCIIGKEKYQSIKFRIKSKQKDV